MNTIGAPTAADVADAAGYVEMLGRLRVWAGRPSFRRLAVLAGTTTSASGDVVDRLPASTAFDLLNGKRLPRLPRMELVEAFVGACLKACHLAPDVVDEVIEQWLSEWRRLAELDEDEDAHQAEPAGALEYRPRRLIEAGAEAAPCDVRPLVGRRDALLTIDAALDGVAAGPSEFVAVVGESGAGKTRLLGELAAAAARRGLVTFWGRSGEYEQEMPLGVLVDALGGRLEGRGQWVRDRLGAGSARLLATVFPSLSPTIEDVSASNVPKMDGFARYQLYLSIRRLLDEMAASSGLVLILDDVHWADRITVELLGHIVRHPPRGPVLIAVAYRPAQVAPRLAAPIESGSSRSRVISLDPFTLAEVEEFLGPVAARTHGQVLHRASRGIPLYLDALAWRGETAPRTGDDENGTEPDELPASVKVPLQMELCRLSPEAVLVARAAAVVADEFEPATVGVAAQVSEGVVLRALDELAACDLVRPAASGPRFRFRHPLVRDVAYGMAPPGWRLAAHARVADHLAGLGAPVTWRAHHVERSGRFGDMAAVATLSEAARAVASHAPATAAHWLVAALHLTAPDLENRGRRLDLLLELARVQMLGGRLHDARESAYEALRTLPADDHARRSRAVYICALSERLLDRPDESRALLVGELGETAQAQSVVSAPLQVRLVADNLYRGDFHKAEAILDTLPETGEDWGPVVRLAVAALRPMTAFAAGRVTDASRYTVAANELFVATSDAQLAEWMDPITWLGWTELFMGRQHSALRRFDRVLTVARCTGRDYAVSMILSGKARAYAMLGQLAEGVSTSQEAMETASVLGSSQLLAIATAQRCMITAWSGDAERALRFGEQALRIAGESGEWWGALAWYAWAVALINAGRQDQGTDAVIRACNGFHEPKLDQPSLLSCCELMAHVETARGRPEEAGRWANRADQLAHQGLSMNLGLANLARAHALSTTAPAAAAEHAERAAGMFAAAAQPIDSGRAQLVAGAAHRDADDPGQARKQLEHASEIFAACGAQGLRKQALRELQRL